MAFKFRVMVKAIAVGYLDGIPRYPEGHHDKSAGYKFTIDERALRRDKDGKIKVDENGKPVLPSWVEAVEEVPAIPKDIPTVVISAAELKFIRHRPQKASGRMAFANWRKKRSLGPVKITAPSDNEEEEDAREDASDAAKPARKSSGDKKVIG